MKKSGSAENREKIGVGKVLFELFTTALTVISIVLSLYVYFDSRDSKPLHYYMETTITPAGNINEFNEYTQDVKFVVSSGAINSVMIMTYHDGNIEIVANVVDCLFTERSGANTLSFSYKNDLPFDELAPFTEALYVLVTGVDGSKDLGMVRIHITEAWTDDTQGNVSANIKCYSLDEILLAERDESEQIYAELFREYRDIRALLKEDGAI